MGRTSGNGPLTSQNGALSPVNELHAARCGRRRPTGARGSAAGFSAGGKPGRIGGVSVQLNHTIVSCRDQQRSAAFLTGILGLPPATRFGHFLVVEADNGVSLDFAETGRDITSQHYAFLVSEEEFDAAFGRIRKQDLPYWADPGRRSAPPSTTGTAAAACTSRTQMVTCWRLLPGPTVAGSPQACSTPRGAAVPAANPVWTMCCSPLCAVVHNISMHNLS